MQVDDIKIAQFLYLLQKNIELRSVIDVLTSKVVLILGRFTSERKQIIDSIRHCLRLNGYCAVIFDFDRPAIRDTDETVNLLARMARFIIADIADAKSIPQELNGIVPFLPSVPVQPLLFSGEQAYGMFDHFQKYPWVMKLFEYNDKDHLLAALMNDLIPRMEQRFS